MDRKVIAWYSYLALLVLLVGFLAASSSRDTYSDPPVALDVGLLALVLLGGLHQWYFRREWGQMRRVWVERRPWLRHVVRTEPQTFRRSLSLSLGSFVLTFVLLTIWIMFVAAP